MKSTMMGVQLSVNHLLERAARYFPSQEIVARRPDKSLARSTYGDLHRRARQLAQALRGKADIGRGDAVATLMWNHAVHLECYFGIPAAGAVLHTLNVRLSAEDIAYIVEDAADRVVIVDDVLLPLWDRVTPLLRTIPRTIVHAFGGGTIPEEYESYEDFIAGDASAYAYPEQDENEALAMCYTSGTTGRPRGVVYSHRSMVLHAITECAPDIIGLSSRDRILVVVPMFHANAWAIPFAAVMAGASQIFPGPHLGGEDLLDLMESEKTTLALGVPTIWLMILQSLESPTRERSLVPDIRMLVGGAAVPVSLIAAFEKHGMHIVQGWGMTEMSPLGSISMLRPRHAALSTQEQYAIRALQGAAPPLVEMRIVGDDGTIQPWDDASAGEIQARGPWITGSYHNMLHDTERFTEDGWLRTGDIGVLNPEGYLRIVDRSKDLIKSGGEWISSVDLENKVMGHPDVAEAAVVAVAHPKWTERPLVVVVPKSGRTVSEADIRAFLEPHFAKWQIPEDYVFVETIPRTSTGKFLKTELRKSFSDYISRTPG
jgi:fatty-acyl-CoA synthase